MIASFSQFTIPKRKYVCLKLDKSSVQAMNFWCAENNFDITKNYSGEDTATFDFHITVFHSMNAVRLSDAEVNLKPIQFTFSELALFGENQNVPVLKVFPNTNLLKVRSTFEALGLQDKWDGWKPHVSVSYNFNGTHSDIQNIKLPVFPVFVDKLIVEDIDE